MDKPASLASLNQVRISGQKVPKGTAIQTTTDLPFFFAFVHSFFVVAMRHFTDGRFVSHSANDGIKEYINIASNSVKSSTSTHIAKRSHFICKLFDPIIWFGLLLLFRFD